VSRILVRDVRYEVRVGGDGPPLLLLHGFTGRGAAWGLHLAHFRRQAMTIQVDLLGHGRSDAPADPRRHAVEQQAADLAEILRRVAGGTADVIGYSFGARVALAMAIDEPASIRRLVLVSPSAGIADPDERAARRAADEALAADIERDGIPAFVERWESLALFTTLATMPAARRRSLHALRLRNRADGLAGSLRGAGQGAMTPLHDRLGTVSAASLVVVGELDPVRSRAESVAAGIPDARLAVVPGAGHAPHIEAPARFRAIVLPFITAPEASVQLPVPEEVA
jgi:2-succinyl-6-hydroxy-2,4-cyclohexadiene-1-carboxylate synthase